MHTVPGTLEVTRSLLNTECVYTVYCISFDTLSLCPAPQRIITTACAEKVQQETLEVCFIVSGPNLSYRIFVSRFPNFPLSSSSHTSGLFELSRGRFVPDTISEGGRSKKSRALAVTARLEVAVLSLRLAALSAVNPRL